MLARARASSSLLPWITGSVLTLVWLVIYLLTVSPSINFIDSGELISALYEPGIAHPPGYPFYTLLGYVVSHLLPGEIAWRVNVISAFFGALAVGALFVLIVSGVRYSQGLGSRTARPVAQPRRRNQPRSQPPAATESNPDANSVSLPALIGAVAAASLLGASDTFWSRAVQAKLYTLHYFLVIVLITLALQLRWAYERREEKTASRWLVALALCFGISATNHPTTAVAAPAIAIMILWGANWRARLLFVLRRAAFWLPALLIPLLLYLYLPLRAAQGPIMNWGSPTTVADFWRHITGWQYHNYFLSDVNGSAASVVGFIGGQWGWLTWPVLILCVLAGVLLWRVNRALLAATLLEGVMAIAFCIAYGSTELEVYLVPLYPMMLVMLGHCPATLELLRRPAPAQRAREASSSPSIMSNQRAAFALPAAVVVLALGTLFLQYPAHDHSRDHLAELFTRNAYSTLEQNAIVFTDNWELFAAPSYYVQQLQKVRPDIVVIDKLLVRYPWYTEQLQRRYPWLIQNSQDIAAAFRDQQERWINNQAYDSARINQLYYDLMNSFIERNAPAHPAYTLLNAPDDQLAPGYARVPAGLALRLYKQPPQNPAPPEPNYDLTGYIDNKTALDNWGLAAANLYQQSYRLTGQFYEQVGLTDQAKRMSDASLRLQSALENR